MQGSLVWFPDQATKPSLHCALEAPWPGLGNVQESAVVLRPCLSSVGVGACQTVQPTVSDYPMPMVSVASHPHLRRTSLILTLLSLSSPLGFFIPAAVAPQDISRQRK